MKMNTCCLTLILLSCLATLCLSGPLRAQNNQEAPALVDSVSTLSLTDTLYSWGRLGGVCVDRLGFIYVSNFADAVWRITPEGEVTRLASSLYGASGNAIDARGNLLQSNFFANSISKISRRGEVSTYASDGLAGPVGIAIGKSGDLYVCNCNSNSIARVMHDGTVTEFSKSDLFQCPNGITFDDEGDLFVVNFSNDHVVKITPDGTAMRFATMGGAGGNAHIVFARGNFYVSKIRTNQIYRVSKAGAVTLLAGTGALGKTDGSALHATFRRPNGIASNPPGDVLYVNDLDGAWGSADRSSLVVRKIKIATLSDILTSLLLKGGIEAAVSAYHSYKQSPSNRSENTEGEMNAFAYQLLRERKIQAAITMFELNMHSYPNSWKALDSLAEVFTIIGNTEAAIERYEKSLQLNPDNDNASRKLKDLRQKIAK